MITKPMLASKCENPHLLPFPVLATPKLDGIRCLKIGGKALTRSFKPISNRFAREWIEDNLPDGVDGELMLRNGTFSETTSAIGRRDGMPDFVFHIFDYVTDSIAMPYHERMTHLAELPDSLHLIKVLPVMIHNADELSAYEEQCITAGYEGVMVRTPNSPYKCGRSTEREAWLLKIKRFEDAEAVVLEPYEGMTNQNAAELDHFGRTKRSLGCRRDRARVGISAPPSLPCQRSSETARVSTSTGFSHQGWSHGCQKAASRALLSIAAGNLNADGGAGESRMDHRVPCTLMFTYSFRRREAEAR